jgi:hypothetical protein
MFINTTPELRPDVHKRFDLPQIEADMVSEVE